MTLCYNNDQTWFSDTLTSAGPSRCLCIENMFDPYIISEINMQFDMLLYQLKLIGPWSTTRRCLFIDYIIMILITKPLSYLSMPI